jgi:hypothetical protein
MAHLRSHNNFQGIFKIFAGTCPAVHLHSALARLTWEMLLHDFCDALSLGIDALLFVWLSSLGFASRGILSQG